MLFSVWNFVTLSAVNETVQCESINKKPKHITRIRKQKTVISKYWLA